MTKQCSFCGAEDSSKIVLVESDVTPGVCICADCAASTVLTVIDFYRKSHEDYIACVDLMKKATEQ